MWQRLVGTSYDASRKCINNNGIGNQRSNFRDVTNFRFNESSRSVDCLVCRSTCVSRCPPRSFPSQNGACWPCHETCETCAGPGQDSCLTCAPAHLRVTDLAVCLRQCPEGYIESEYELSNILVLLNFLPNLSQFILPILLQPSVRSVIYSWTVHLPFQRSFLFLPAFSMRLSSTGWMMAFVQAIAELHILPSATGSPPNHYLPFTTSRPNSLLPVFKTHSNSPPCTVALLPQQMLHDLSSLCNRQPVPIKSSPDSYYFLTN